MAELANTFEATEAFQARLKSAKRNDECPCGSGKKYKKCHLQEDEAKLHALSLEVQRQAEAARAAELAAAEEEGDADDDSPAAKKNALASKSALKGKRVTAGGGKPQQGGPRPNNLPRRKAV
ncbi:MAG: motif [Pseudomonadota bacterium]|jgi:FKBP-type peptidyl-prolyl cis-trans isomerase